MARPALPFGKARKAPKPLFPTTAEAARTARYADLLLQAIKTELAAANFFTREDLLQLRVFQHVSTITRYHEICLAMHVLLSKGAVVAMSRTDLVLSEQRDRYRTDEPIATQYMETIRKVVRGFGKQTFAVMDVVGAWKSDLHLTINNKRVAVRGALKRLAHEELIRATGEFEFTLAPATKRQVQ
jgi:hypothetical protein